MASGDLREERGPLRGTGHARYAGLIGWKDSVHAKVVIIVVVERSP